MANYKKYSKDLKAKVALEAIKANKTIAELALEYSLHPTQITRWKQEAEANFSRIFEKNDGISKELKKKKQEFDDAIKQLGQATLEKEWLKKKLIPCQ